MAIAIPYASKDDLIKQEQEQAANTQAAEERISGFENVANNLSAYISGKWDIAKRAKLPHEEQIFKNWRQRDGIYESDKLAAIQQMHGKDYAPVYMMLTSRICRAGSSWIKDILFQPGDEPFDVKPTPVPDLPDAIEEQINRMISSTFIQMIVETNLQQGLPISAEIIQTELEQYLPNIKERIHKAIFKKAKESAVKMKEKIADQFYEGGWYKELYKCIDDFVCFPAAILKGPFLVREKVWDHQIDMETGRFTPEIKDSIIYKYKCVHPLDIYPAPDSLSIEDGWLFHRTSYTREALNELIGVPGYKEEAIRAVLRDYQSGYKEVIASDSERATLEGKTTTSIYDGEKIDCLEYWGSVPGRMLKDWGLDDPAVQDDERDYQAVVRKIGPHVIRAMINPDPMGRKPFSKASFIEDNSSFWGKGVPQLVKDDQSIVNAIARALVNNVGIASGPLTEINRDRKPPGTSNAIWPWKVWETTDQAMSGAPAIRFYTPPLIARELNELLTYFLEMAHVDAGIPKYGHGKTDISGAGKTASGLSMIMSTDARDMKEKIENIDYGIIVTSTERQFEMNIMYEKDISLIGDMKIVAKGSSSLIAKEQQAVRRSEFLVNTLNQYDMQIVGLDGRRKLLKDAIQALELDPDEILGEEAGINMQQAAIMPPAVPEQPNTQQSAMSPGNEFGLFGQNKGIPQ